MKSYVLPRFKVAVELDRPFYQPGQRVKGRVQARYVFGKPVADGAVTLALQTVEVKPEARGPLTLHTDADGAAEFELRLPESLVGREQDSDHAKVAFTATVRDPAGQTQSRTETRIVTNQPIRIEVIPEGGTLVEGLPNTIHLLTSTPDGRPVAARLNVTGVDHELRTSALGAASFEFTPQPPDDTVSWTVQASDDQGRTSRRQVTLTCGKLSGDYLIRTDKAVYRGGEPMHVLALGSGIEPVFLDLIKDGQTVLSETIELNKGRGELEIDLPPELAGTVLLCAYRYGPGGLPVRKTRVVQIQPASQLRLQASLDRTEYRPGERARLSFTLADPEGRPVPGAISLAAVDEAVFGVLESRPGLERTFFTLEQELLKPIYEIKEWSPEEFPDPPGKETSSADRRLFEQALFARTARGPDDRIRAIKAALSDDPDISDLTLRVLDRPDWEALADRAALPAGTVELLRRASGPHTLSASSYPEKVARVESIRRTAADMLGMAWVILVATALIGAFLWALLNAEPPGRAIDRLR